MKWQANCCAFLDAAVEIGRDEAQGDSDDSHAYVFCTDSDIVAGD